MNRSDEYYRKIFGFRKEHVTPVSAQNAEIEANRPKPIPQPSHVGSIRRRFYHIIGGPLNGGTLIKHGWIDGRELSSLRWNEELRNSEAKRSKA